MTEIVIDFEIGIHNPNSVEEHFLKLFFGMPFLKSSDIEEYFLELCEILPCNNFGIVQFAPHIWASASNVSYRTTNACESFHAKFNTSFYQNHPIGFIAVSIRNLCQNKR
jgi:hypothetical protein